MPDVTLDEDGPGGTLARRMREVAPGVYAAEVVLAQPLAGAQGVPVVQAIPLAADVQGGTGAAGATILNVPAGRTWRGSVAVAVSAVAAIGAAAVTLAGRVNVAGVGAVPAVGALVECPVSLAVTTATATMGASGHNSVVVTDVLVVAPAGNAVTLAVAADAGANVRATARGMLVA